MAVGVLTAWCLVKEKFIDWERPQIRVEELKSSIMNPAKKILERASNAWGALVRYARRRNSLAAEHIP